MSWRIYFLLSATFGILFYFILLVLQPRYSQLDDRGNGDRMPIMNLHEHGMHSLHMFKKLAYIALTLFSWSYCIVGLQKILSLLDSEDPNVRLHAVKVVANLAAEGHSFLKPSYQSYIFYLYSVKQKVLALPLKGYFR